MKRYTVQFYDGYRLQVWAVNNVSAMRTAYVVAVCVYDRPDSIRPLFVVSEINYI